MQYIKGASGIRKQRSIHVLFCQIVRLASRKRQMKTNETVKMKDSYYNRLKLRLAATPGQTKCGRTIRSKRTTIHT